ncbi:MAG: hypothetical protein DRJ98_02265 [Thermoprotei archaeon]|nr:MAG: hypothetical protein DRJ98_02090 [Thermoprotei archaeon]RLF11932.1 MAG: hypothetical protein DRJ98_02265 [Thermoprotei archaeon]
MLKIAVLNNYPEGKGKTALKRIKRSLKRLGVKPIVVRPEACLQGGYDAFILTGTAPCKGLNGPKLKDEKILVRHTSAPVLGICFGLHLIAQSFGMPLVKMTGRRVGFKELRIHVKEALFEGLENPLVWENHRARVSEEVYEDSRFTVLASSLDNPVEALKVNGRKIYGVQFHPERYDKDRPWGFSILQNFINAI